MKLAKLKGWSGRLALVMLAAFVLGSVALAGGEPDPAYILTQEDFTQVTTQILTYLGYAVVAGLAVLAAVLGARRAWSFFRRFI